MRRVLAAFALLLLPGLVLAEQPRTNAFSTAGTVEIGQALTDGGRFGVPRTPTASLFTCNSTQTGAVRFDTTIGGAVICNGTAWAAIAASGTGASSVTGDFELRDPAQLAAESLTNGVLTAGTSWTASGDFALTGNAATYTHSAGSGAFQQTSAAGAIPWATAGINGWFSLTYTTSAVTGSPVCTIPSTFALTAQTLTNPAGTYTIVFQAMASTVGAFSISCTSGAAATITFDTLSLKQINGGDLTVQGRILVGQGAAAQPAISPIFDPTSGFLFPSASVIRVATAGSAKWAWSVADYIPVSNDASTLGNTTNMVMSSFVSRSTQGAKTKSLTDAGAAVAVIRVPVATSGYQSGEVIWATESTDATDFRTTSGRIRFAGVNKGGTNTCTVNVVGTDLTASSNANTLVCTWTNVVNTTNCDLSVTCTDNTAGTQTMTARFRADMTTLGVLTFP